MTSVVKGHQIRMMESDRLINEIEHRLSQILQQLKDGQDCSPSAQIRLEGLMEAAVICGISKADKEQNRFERLYKKVYEHPIERDFGDDWRAFFTFPSLPLFARRAPVVPTTSD